MSLNNPPISLVQEKIRICERNAKTFNQDFCGVSNLNEANLTDLAIGSNRTIDTVGFSGWTACGKGLRSTGETIANDSNHAVAIDATSGVKELTIQTKNRMDKSGGTNQSIGMAFRASSGWNGGTPGYFIYLHRFSSNGTGDWRFKSSNKQDEFNTGVIPEATMDSLLFSGTFFFQASMIINDDGDHIVSAKCWRSGVQTSFSFTVDQAAERSAGENGPAGSGSSSTRILTGNIAWWQ